MTLLHSDTPLFSHTRKDDLHLATLTQVLLGYQEFGREASKEYAELQAGLAMALNRLLHPSAISLCFDLEGPNFYESLRVQIGTKRARFEYDSPLMIPKVKVCCIKSVAEAKTAISYGASALGLVSSMPSGPGVIAEERISAIAASVPPPIATFLLTSEIDPERIIAQQRRCGTSTLQLCDHLPSSVYAPLREALPGIKLVQVVHVENQGSVDYALSAATHVDALLLDSGRLSMPVKEFGGTGRTHDWRLSKQIRESIKCREGNGDRQSIRNRSLQRRPNGRPFGQQKTNELLRGRSAQREPIDD